MPRKKIAKKKKDQISLNPKKEKKKSKTIKKKKSTHNLYHAQKKLAGPHLGTRGGKT